MFFLLSKILDVLVSPLMWALLLCGASFLRRFKNHRGRFVLAAMGVLWLFSMEPFSDVLWRNLERDAGPVPPAEARWDAVVLLGGVVDGSGSSPEVGTSYNNNVERLLRTFELLHEDRARVAILSGAMADDAPPSEATQMADQLARWGIPRERLILEHHAKNTRENAVNVAKVLAENSIGSFVIITSAFHMERARECFRAVGLSPDTFPVDFRVPASGYPIALMPRAREFEVSGAAIREGFGRWVYRARGYAVR